MSLEVQNVTSFFGSCMSEEGNHGFRNISMGAVFFFKGFFVIFPETLGYDLWLEFVDTNYG